MAIVLAIKAVKQNYVPPPQIINLLEQFRRMINDCIRIGFNENTTSLKSLSMKAYHELDRYDVPTSYRLTAISKAVAILRNYRKTAKKHPNAKKPYASKPILSDCYSFRIINNQLRLPIKPRQYNFIPLNNHTLTIISGCELRSVVLTASTISIAFSKEATVIEPSGLIGIDRNLDNITLAASDGQIKCFDLSAATKAKSLFREVKSHFKRNDVRLAKRTQKKYGMKQRNKVQPILHNVSKRIVDQAKAQKYSIVLEDLKGIRKLYRKGNWQGRKFRSKMNSWSFYELQRQIEYKARWEGIPVIYVNPQWTSSTCAICGSIISECKERKVYCSKCKNLMDRDVNAALNIVTRGMRFMPVGFTVEAMVKEFLYGNNPLSRCEPVNLPHDG